MASELDFAKVGHKTVKDKTNKIVRNFSTFFQEVILRVTNILQELVNYLTSLNFIGHEAMPV